MKIRLLLLLLLPFTALGQAPLDSTLLPIIWIHTNGGTIVNEPKILADMGIIDNGPGMYNHWGDSANNYDGKIGIEYRGSSSQFLFDKKNFGIELWKTLEQDTSLSLLGLPAEEDWVLHGPYSDKTLMRNALTFKLWEASGHYGSRTRYVELVVNNDYRGVYVLMEKIKRDKHRVAISKLNPDENSGDDLTGGYIVKLDKYDGNNSGEGWESPFEPPGGIGQPVAFQYDYPKIARITNQQKSYIRDFVTDFETALAGPDFRDPVEGYRAYIHVNTFIDFAIINEVNRNVDGYRLSTFLYKDKDSVDPKMSIGPIWDFNLAWGNANYCEGDRTEGWAWDFNTYCNEDTWLIPFWWSRLLLDQEYTSQFVTRWNELRTDEYSTPRIHELIDSIALVLEKPQQRNFQRWPVLGEWVWPNSFVGDSYAAEIQHLKSWLTSRMLWLDTHINELPVVTDVPMPNPSIRLYPNPVADQLTVSGLEDGTLVSIVDVHGRKLSSLTARGHTLTFDVTGVRKGLYVVVVQTRSGLIWSKKFIR